MLLVSMHKRASFIKNLISTGTITQKSILSLWHRSLHGNQQAKHLTYWIFRKRAFYRPTNKAMFCMKVWMFSEVTPYIIQDITDLSYWSLGIFSKHFPLCFTDLCSARADQKYPKVYYSCKIFWKVSYKKTGHLCNQIQTTHEVLH